MKKRWTRPYLNIVPHWKIWYAISAVMLAVSIVALLTGGLNFGIDFTGGTSITVKTESPTSIADIRAVTGRFGYGAAQIQSSPGNTYVIRVPELEDQEREDLIAELDKDIGLAKDGDGNLIVDVKDVGPGWGARVSRQAIIAFLVFILAILVYISFRFEFKMAVTAIIEVLHDFIITIGVYALLGFEVTPATVIAVLTILGYSLYDTIVVFDRVKENADQLTRQSRKTYSQTVNDSLNQMLVRSINTSLTTLTPIVCVLLFGGETLRAFALPLFLGVVSGTYTSIVLSPPILAQLKETEPKYRAYREQVERGKGKGQGAAKPASGKAAAGAAAPSGKKKQQSAQAKKKAAPVAKPASKPVPKPKPVSGPGTAAGGKTSPGSTGEKAGEAPGDVPKPKPKQKPPGGKAAAPTSKNLAKSRTKGPGSGKKKKKKK